MLSLIFDKNSEKTKKEERIRRNLDNGKGRQIIVTRKDF